MFRGEDSDIVHQVALVPGNQVAQGVQRGVAVGILGGWAEWPADYLSLKSRDLVNDELDFRDESIGSFRRFTNG